jgi:hypothetical protein
LAGDEIQWWIQGSNKSLGLYNNRAIPDNLSNYELKKEPVLWTKREATFSGYMKYACKDTINVYEATPLSR